MAVTVVVVSILIAIWPVEDANDGWIQAVTLPFVGNLGLTDEVRLLLIVVLSGAAGSCIGALTSFATYVGNRSLVASWNWWYVLRPFIGMTRIPILDHKNIASGVIHQSPLFKYIAEKSIDLQKRQQSFDFDSATLEQLLNYGGMRGLITASLAFVPLNATVADAKMAMEQTEDCQDVFITQVGSKSEPVPGWLTKVDISNLT